MFPQYLEKIGKEAWGWKCRPFERFPLLIKLIDATKSLSVQVHPDDEYAMSVEGEYGKNEMWYVMDATSDAGLYVGFKEELTREECRKHVEDGTLTDVLQRVPVKKGDENGNKRELHLDKALDNLNYSVYPCDCKPAGEPEAGVSASTAARLNANIFLIMFHLL